MKGKTIGLLSKVRPTGVSRILNDLSTCHRHAWRHRAGKFRFNQVRDFVHKHNKMEQGSCKCKQEFITVMDYGRRDLGHKGVKDSEKVIGSKACKSH